MSGVGVNAQTGVATTRIGVITTMSAPTKSFKKQTTSAKSTVSATALSGLYYDRFDNPTYYTA